MPTANCGTDALSDVITRLDRGLLEGNQRITHSLSQALHSGHLGQALLPLLDPAAREGSEAGYLRRLAYADPQGRFYMLFLVWRNNQFSPVHGHRTWCAYTVLAGELEEAHFQWDNTANTARQTGAVKRCNGDVVTAAPGLAQIHRLGNAKSKTAISLHIYGVDQDSISTGVNLLVPSHPRESWEAAIA